MSINIATKNLVLTKQLVSASGTNNMLYVNGVEVTSGVSGNLILTGQQLFNLINNTGSQAWNAANNNGINLSGNLTQTGVQLGNSINALSGYLGNVSGGLQAQISASAQIKVTGSSNISSANFTGAGNVSVFTSGSSIIFISGNSNDALNLSGSLTQTGILLTNRDTLISGILTTGLLLTGQQLYALTTGLSGYMVALIGASAAGVSSINGASGVLTIAGAPASNISVTTVGQNIIVSGNTGDYALFAQKTALTTTGQTLLANDFLISGILTTGLLQTGQNLYNLITAASGQYNTNFATITNLALTGSQAWNAANNNGINLSGNLTSTGVQLGASIAALSGYLNNTFITTGSMLSYVTGVTTGVDTSYFSYQTYTFSTIPRVYVTMELTTSNIMYGHIVSGRSTTGFFVVFSDVVTETGIYLDVLAKS